MKVYVAIIDKTTKKLKSIDERETSMTTREVISNIYSYNQAKSSTTILKLINDETTKQIIDYFRQREKHQLVSEVQELLYVRDSLSEMAAPPPLIDHSTLLNATTIEQVYSPKYVGSRLKKARLFINITQERLANYLKKSRGYIAKYEGKDFTNPSPEVYQDILSFIDLIGVLKKEYGNKIDVVKFFNVNFDFLDNKTIDEYLSVSEECQIKEILYLAHNMYSTSKDVDFG